MHGYALHPVAYSYKHLGRTGGHHPANPWAIEEMPSSLSRTGALEKSAMATDG